MAVPLRAIVAERQLGARQLERSVLDEINARDASAGWSSGDNELAKLYYSQLTEALGRRVKLRQPAVATAIVFFRRFYSERSLLDADPLLIAPTALWAASKVEECPVGAKAILRELSELEQQQPYELCGLIAAEPMLLEALGFALLMPHPHVPLARLCKHAISAAAAHEPMSADERKSLVHTAHALLTDCYKTDCCLWCPPLALALACLQTVSTQRRSQLNRSQLSRSRALAIAHGHSLSCECASLCAQAAELLKVPLQGLLPTPSDELQRHAELATGSLHMLFERCARLQPREASATRERLDEKWRPRRPGTPPQSTQLMAE